jgi:hypothetical protein
MGCNAEQSRLPFQAALSSREFNARPFSNNRKGVCITDKAVSGQRSKINKLDANWFRTAEVLRHLLPVRHGELRDLREFPRSASANRDPFRPDGYENTPAGEMRRIIAANSFPRPGDAAKVAQAMIDSVDLHPAPKRLPLGSDTYTLVRAALVERLHALDMQKESALAADTNSR